MIEKNKAKNRTSYADEYRKYLLVIVIFACLFYIVNPDILKSAVAILAVSVSIVFIALLVVVTIYVLIFLIAELLDSISDYFGD